MYKRLFQLLTITLLISSITACVHSSLPAKIITAENSKTLCTPLTLQKDQTVIIKLPSNSFTGYKWQIENDGSPILHFQKAKIDRDETLENYLHNDQTVWTFIAKKLGKTTISMNYQLAWETETTDQQHFQCEIFVTK